VSALSALYGRATAIRRSWYERHPSSRRRLARPVISVGNLAVGGSGKTPIVAALACMLVEMGHRPAILSRGYARRKAGEGVTVVSDGHRMVATVDESGDEPLMLARALPAVPVLVSGDRFLSGSLAEHRLGASVLLLDDGFQHLQLARTIDLLVVSVTDLDDQVLPAGRLREPLAAARAADALLVHGGDDARERVAARLGRKPAFDVRVAFEPLQRLAAGQATAGERPVEGRHRVLAVAGIARPERFVDALRQQGHEVVGAMMFRDHHWFTPDDVARVVAAARNAGADLVATTEKDAVRVEALAAASGMTWAVLPMRASIHPAAFRGWIADRLADAVAEPHP
jgi:tetraacyldisaccharide 4'-kinase